MMTYGAIALLLWAGTRDTVGSSAVSIGTLTAFALLLQRFFTPVTALGDEWQTVQGALSGAERIFDVLAMPANEQAPRTPPTRAKNGVVCDDVVFGYTAGVPYCTASLYMLPPVNTLHSSGALAPERPASSICLPACMRRGRAN